jgi:hypothetical protein
MAELHRQAKLGRFRGLRRRHETLRLAAAWQFASLIYCWRASDALMTCCFGWDRSRV